MAAFWNTFIKTFLTNIDRSLEHFYKKMFSFNYKKIFSHNFFSFSPGIVQNG